MAVAWGDSDRMVKDKIRDCLLVAEGPVMAPKAVHTPIFRPGDMTPYAGHRSLDLRWGDGPGLSGGPSLIIRFLESENLPPLCSGKTGPKEQWSKRNLKGGGRSHKPRNAGDLLKLERYRHGFFPRAPRKRERPADALISAQRDPRQASDQYNYRIINRS